MLIKNYDLSEYVKKAWKKLSDQIKNYRSQKRFCIAKKRSEKEAEDFKRWSLLDTPKEHRKWFKGLLSQILYIFTKLCILLPHIYLLSILRFPLDLSWTAKEYETKLDILREIHFRRTKSYACGNGMDADVKRKFKEKLQNLVCDCYINYHPGLLICLKIIKVIR